jgi:hypothetical protein
VALPGARAGRLARLKAAADAQVPDSGNKLDRAPTLVAVSALVTGDPVQDEEDLLSAGCAAYAVLLGAHAAGWRATGARPPSCARPRGPGRSG